MSRLAVIGPGLCTLGAIWALLALTTLPTPAVALHVLPRFALAPSGVRLTITVERDPANRWLTVEVDGPAYYSSSRERLAGIDAPRLRQRAYDGLPAGRYEARAIVQRNDRQTHTARAAFCFSGPDESCAEER